jgi:hypothetical protein
MTYQHAETMIQDQARTGEPDLLDQIEGKAMAILECVTRIREAESVSEKARDRVRAGLSDIGRLNGDIAERARRVPIS